MNIDKDIEIVKGLINYLKEDFPYNAEEYIQAIENVLLRLEEWEKAHNLINESAVRIDNTPTTSTLEVDLNKLFTHIGFLDNATLVNIKLKNTTRYKVDLDTNKSELEKKDKEIDRLKEELGYDHKEYRRMLRDIKSELETYKKIAEKLAEELGKEYSNSEPCSMETIAGIYNCGGKTCIQCIIDWAKREVENEL